jgi:hypothetical protein
MEDAIKFEEQPKDTCSSKRTIARILLIVYALVLAGGMIIASLYFINLTVSPMGGPYLKISSEPTITIQPNQTFAFDIATIFVNGNVPIYGFCTENHTFYNERNSLPKATATGWDICRIRSSLWSNETYNVWVTSYDPNGVVIRNITSQAVGTPLLEADINQEGTYSVEIRNDNPTDAVNATLRINVEWEYFEKPYYYYGIAGLVIGLIYPISLGLFILRNIIKFIMEA